jgi:hypothetical protein
MAKPKKAKGERGNIKVAEAARERELRDLIARIETKKSDGGRPPSESPHDFIERKMREKLEK